MSTSNGRINTDFVKAYKAFSNEYLKEDGTKDETKTHITINRSDEDNTKIHFVIKNMEDKRYNKGIYYCMLLLSKEHPHKPPSFYTFNNSSRFKVYHEADVGKDNGVCFSFTKWHAEQWSPIQNVESLIRSFISFFLEDPVEGYQGSVTSTDDEKIESAFESPLELKNNKTFLEFFPEYNGLLDKLIKERNLVPKKK